MTTLKDVIAAVQRMEASLRNEIAPEVLARLDRLDAIVRETQATAIENQAAIQGKVSRLVKGDRAAMEIVGYKHRDSFKGWLERAGIRPKMIGGVKYYERDELEGGKA